MNLLVWAPGTGLSAKIINYRQTVDVFVPSLSCKRANFPLQTRYNTNKSRKRENHKYIPNICVVSSDLEDVGFSSQFEDFSITSSSTNKAKELKMSVEVAGVKTQAIFDDVFSKMVADAQPIPGFRRVKGGKTPNEGLKVGKDLRVEQSFEDLEAMFEPGEEFSFDVVIQLHEMN